MGLRWTEKTPVCLIWGAACRRGTTFPCAPMVTLARISGSVNGSASLMTQGLVASVNEPGRPSHDHAHGDAVRGC